MDNMQIYESYREPPASALRSITAGRLKGKTDINPMWRIKALTECFGPAGIGWKAPITNKWIERTDIGEAACFVEINLYVKVDGEWSEPILGIGGSMFIVQERNGPHVNDECYKMAYTDAISVACKALGFAADIYWDADATKYTTPEIDSPICPECGKRMLRGVKISDKTFTPEQFISRFGCCSNCFTKKRKNIDS